MGSQGEEGGALMICPYDDCGLNVPENSGYDGAKVYCYECDTELPKEWAKAIISYKALLDACGVALSQLTEDREEYFESDIKQIKNAIVLAKGGK